MGAGYSCNNWWCVAMGCYVTAGFPQYLYYWVGYSWTAGGVWDNPTCYNSRATLVYNDWSAYGDGSVNNPGNAKIALSATQFSPSTFSWSQIKAKSFSGWGNDLKNTTYDLYIASEELMGPVTSANTYDDSYMLSKAMYVLDQSMTDLLANSSRVVSSGIYTAAKASSGGKARPNSFNSAQVLRKLGNWLVDKSDTADKSAIRDILAARFPAVATDRTALKATFDPTEKAFRTNSSAQWSGLYNDVIKNLNSLNGRIVTLNSTLQGFVTGSYSQSRQRVTGVSDAERLFNSSFISNSSGLLGDVVTLQGTLDNSIVRKPLDMFSLAPVSADANSRLNMGYALGNSSSQLAASIGGSKDTYLAFIQGKFNVTRDQLAGNLVTLQSRTAVAGLQTKIDASLSATSGKADVDKGELLAGLIGLQQPVIGRAIDLQAASNVSQALHDHITAQGETSKLQIKSASVMDLMNSRETSLTNSVSDNSQFNSGSMADAITKMIGDVFKQRDAVLDTAAANYAEMQSQIAEVAASVGMNLTDFVAQIVTAQKALQNMHSTTGSTVTDRSRGFAQNAASLSAAAVNQLQSQAVATTLAAQNSNQDINSLSDDLLSASNDAALATSQTAGSSMSAVSGLTGELANSGASVLGSIEANATAQAGRSAALSNLLTSSRSASSSLTSQIAVASSTGTQQLSLSGDTVSSAFGAVFDQVESYLNEEVRHLADRVTDEQNDASDKLTALIDWGKQSTVTLKPLADAIDSQIATMQPVIAELPTAQEAVSSITSELALERHFADSAAGNASLAMSQSQKMAQSAAATLGRSRGQQTRALVKERVAITKNLQDSALSLSKTRDNEIRVGLSLMKQTRQDTLDRMRDIVGTNTTFTSVTNADAKFRSSQSQTKAGLLAEHDAVSQGHLAAAQLHDSYSNLNGTLVIAANAIAQAAPQQISQLKKAVSDGATDLLTAKATSMQALGSSIVALSKASAASIDPSDDPKVLATSVTSLTSSVNETSTDLVDDVSEIISQQNDLVNAQVLTPAFGLVESLGDYAKSATESLSQSALASAAVKAASTGVMTGFWSTSNSAKSQASATLAASQADAELLVKQNDLDSNLEAQLTKAASTAASGAVSTFAKTLDAAQAASKADIKYANDRIESLSSDWKSESNSLGGLISQGLAEASTKVAGSSNSGFTVLAQNLMGHFLEQWSSFQSGDKLTIAGIPNKADAKLTALGAALMASATGSSTEVSNAVKNIRSILSVFDKLRVSGISFSGYPLSAQVPLGSARGALTGFETTGLSELQTELDKLIEEREAQAADNIIGIYRALKKVVADSQDKAARVAQFQTPDF